MVPPMKADCCRASLDPGALLMHVAAAATCSGLFAVIIWA